LEADKTPVKGNIINGINEVTDKGNVSVIHQNAISIATPAVIVMFLFPKSIKEINITKPIMPTKMKKLENLFIFLNNI
jgi:flagellin-specific chaperone FliS